MVSERFAHFPEYRGLPEPPGGVNGPSWALVERGGGGQVEARAPKAETELD